MDIKPIINDWYDLPIPPINQLRYLTTSINDQFNQFYIYYASNLEHFDPDSKALEQAIELWIKNDVVEKLKQKLLKGDSTQEEFENLADGLS